MTSWVYLPEPLRSHPAIVDTELEPYSTGSRMILPPSREVVSDIDRVLARLSSADDEAWIYAHFLRLRVHEWVRKYGTYQGFGDQLVPPTQPGQDAAQMQEVVSAPARKVEPRLTGVDLNAHLEVYRNVAARATKKKVRPRQPVPDVEFYPGTNMYLCKESMKWYNIDPDEDVEVMREFEMALNVEDGLGMGSSGKSDGTDSSGSSGKGSF